MREDRVGILMNWVVPGPLLIGAIGGPVIGLITFLVSTILLMHAVVVTCLFLIVRLPTCKYVNGIENVRIFYRDCGRREDRLQPMP